MDIDDLTYVGTRDVPDEQNLHRRYRFRLGGQDIDAVLTESAATVWRQARPDAGEEDLDRWAGTEGGRALRRRLTESPLDFSDLYLDRDVGVGGDGDRPRYGEGGVAHR
jgi:hypothetical protein